MEILKEFGLEVIRRGVKGKRRHTNHTHNYVVLLILVKLFDSI